MSRWGVASAAVAAVAMAVLVPTVAASAAVSGGNPSRSIDVEAGIVGSRVVVAQSTVISIRLRNTTGRRLSNLELGESIVVDGNPDAVPARWNPPLDHCEAAAGTVYCWLPALAPHAAWTARLTFAVPGRLGSTGPPMTGKTFQFVVFVDGHHHPESRVVRLNRAISAAIGLPFTGARISRQVELSCAAIMLGLLLLAAAAGPRRRQTAA